MDIYEFIKSNFNLEINIEYELTKEMRKSICNHFNFTKDKIGKIIKDNINIFKYYRKLTDNKLKYYLTLLDPKSGESEKDKYDDDRFQIIENYLGLEFIMMKSNRYVNITKLCDREKQYCFYTKTKNYKEMCELLTKEGITEVSISVNSASNTYKGIYVHEKLAIAVATWISIEFLYKVTDIISKHVKEQHEIELRLKSIQLEEKEDKIDKLSKIVNDQSKELQEIKEMHRESLANTKELITMNKQICSDLNSVKNTLANIKENIVPEDDWAVLKLYKISDTEFYVVRCINKPLRPYKHKYWDEEPIHEMYLPSSIQYFSDFRNIVRKTNTFKIKRNSIVLVDNTNEDDLLCFVIRHHINALELYLKTKSAL